MSGLEQVESKLEREVDWGEAVFQVQQGRAESDKICSKPVKDRQARVLGLRD